MLARVAAMYNYQRHLWGVGTDDTPDVRYKRKANEVNLTRLVPRRDGLLYCKVVHAIRKFMQRRAHLDVPHGEVDHGQRKSSFLSCVPFDVLGLAYHRRDRVPEVDNRTDDDGTVSYQ